MFSAAHFFCKNDFLFLHLTPTTASTVSSTAADGNAQIACLKL